MVGVRCETVVATDDHPYDAIVTTANEHHCDLIIMTARYRRGLAALLMGSEAERVLHRTSIPVLMFRALMSVDHPDKTLPTENLARFHGLRQRDTRIHAMHRENDLCS